MEIYTATLIIQKHLNWQNDKRNLPKVNEEKLKEAINLLTDLFFNILDNHPLGHLFTHTNQNKKQRPENLIKFLVSLGTF